MRYLEGLSPSVLYYGPRAAETAERWNASDPPFDVRGLEPDPPEWPTLAEDPFDCLVCVSDGESDALALVNHVREQSDTLPVLVVATTDGVSVATAADHGASNVVQIPGTTNLLSRLQDVEPLVERALRGRFEHSMLDSLFRNIPVGVYFKDRDSRHLRVDDNHLDIGPTSHIENPEGKRHVHPDDLVGKTDFDLFAPEIATEAVADDRHVVETGESIDKVERLGTAFDGLYTQTSKARWSDDTGRILGVVGTTKDVTERERYRRELEHQNEQLERVVRVLSHDLRNPLNVARGRLDFVEHDGEHVGAIDRALRRMDELIDDILTLARQGDAVTDPEAVSLVAVASDAWDVVQSDGATLELETDVTVLAEPGRTKQVFENLFRNAVEHGTDEGDVTVTVGDLDDREGFFVADDGVGIPENERSSVFEAGFSTADDGTGFGLDIVRTIAEAHGWNVSATVADGARSDERSESSTRERDASPGARFEFTDVDVVAQSPEQEP